MTPTPPQPGLSAEDARILDALIEAGFDPGVVAEWPDAARQRAERLLGLFDLMNDYPVEDGDETLVHATLARIDRYEDERSARLAFEDRRESAMVPSWRRILMPDFISVAAVLLIAAGIFWPVLSTIRDRSIDFACSNNLRLDGYAFSQYAADFGNELPMARAGFGGSWDTVSNVINLAPLVRNGYCEPANLQCPGVHEHDHADASYSYQWQRPGLRPIWGGGATTTVVLGDRNPLIDAFYAGRHVLPLAGSRNHGGRGQNVLNSDGATMWLDRPVVGANDNIWLPTGLDWLRRGAQPGERDVFLAH